MLTTRNIFKRENFNIKNTEATFYSFKQFGHSSLNIGGMKIQLKYFVVFPSTKRIKLLNTSKTKAFWTISSNVSYITGHR